MNIKHIVEQFKTENFSEWEMVKNRNTQSLWIRRDNSSLKVNIRKDGDGEFYVRLYKLLELGEFNGINYRITITPESIEMCTLQLAMQEPDETISIVNYNNLLSEDNFFQQSLVQDLADLECNNISDLKHLYELAVSVGEEVI